MNKNNHRKQLGIWICTALVIGNMMGSGIFLLPASLAPYGGISIVGWLVTAFGAIMTALVFARLSKNTQQSGGPYIYARQGFGAFAGFIVAWGYWVSIWCGNAAISTAMVSYLSFFWPELAQNPLLSLFVALTAIWVLTLVNIKGVREAGIIQLITTILKISPIIILAVAGIFTFQPAQFEPFNLSTGSNISAISATAALTLWAFLGLESATIPAGDVENASDIIPRATIQGTLATALVYILSMVAIMSLVPNEQLLNSSAPFADAAVVLWGDLAGYLIAAVAVISCLGALNGWILCQGQIPLAAAKDGVFPKIFKLESKNNTPYMGLIISSVLVSVLTLANYSKGLVGFFTFAILLSTLTVLLPYLLSILKELKDVKNNWFVEKAWRRLLIASFALLYSLWAIWGIGFEAVFWGVVLLISGVPVYLHMTKK